MATRRAPLITVPSDDFEIEEDGKTYKPHEGEVVTFKRRISSHDLLVIAEASELKDTGEEGGAELARFFYNDACPVLARAIFSWTWTDMYTDEPLGKPLGKKSDEERQPSVDDLRALDALSEIQYLLDKWLDVTAPDEKNLPKP